MKHILMVSLAVINFATFGQQNQTVNLRWKVAKNEKLNYKTVMKEDDKEAMDKYELITTLTNKGDGVFNIVITNTPKETTDGGKASNNVLDKELLKANQSVAPSVALRGTVYETGEVQSFWIKKAQKNLIALFFELPHKPVKVGDKWPIDVNLIANDPNFDCDSAYRNNEVTLKEIRQIDGDTIAILNYNIVEYVKGKLDSPSSYFRPGGTTAVMMKITYTGIAEFSVSKGRWTKYDGLYSCKGIGEIVPNSNTIFKLIAKNNDGN